MREPKFVIEDRKVKELLKRLKPITDYSELKKGQLIFHDNDNNIFNINKFSEFNKEDNIVWYKNKNVDNMIYDMSATGWYYYDESIADEIQNEFTPKLWWSHRHGNAEDMWFTVCNTVEELRQRYVDEFKVEISMEDFEENYDYDIIEEVDDYKVVLE